MQNWINQDEFDMGYDMTEEELGEIREAETMEILSDPNEDPPMTEEEERAYEQRIDDYLTRMDKDEDDGDYDIDPAYDPSYDFNPHR